MPLNPRESLSRNTMELTKNDSSMLKGFAILCMVVLHLFCRTGADVYGKPIYWLNETTPFVYLFGFFAEVCVPIYTFCAGYAQAVLSEKNTRRNLLFDNVVRIFKLMINYWIVLVLFSTLGILSNQAKVIPNSFKDFVLNVFLIKKYNGAWWFLPSYIILTLISPLFINLLKKFTRPVFPLVILSMLMIVWAFIKKFVSPQTLCGSHYVLLFIVILTFNVIGLICSYCVGILFYHHKLFTKAHIIFDKLMYGKSNNVMIVISSVFLFISANVIHKAIVMPFVAVFTIVLFSLFEKPRWFQNLFLYLGKHSTNIWLVHMFFFIYLFSKYVMSVQYPLFIFSTVMALSILSSHLIIAIYNPVVSVINATVAKRNVSNL